MSMAKPNPHLFEYRLHMKDGRAFIIGAFDIEDGIHMITFLDDTGSPIVAYPADEVAGYRRTDVVVSKG